MGDMMSFPKTFEEFAEQYKIVDKEQIYTNGSELIPIFRVKQWLWHISEDDRADFVEVVRRKDCRHYEADIVCEGVGYCNEHQKGMRYNNFCSYGERKGGK